MEHGGHQGDVLDFSANINPAGLLPWVRSCIQKNIFDICHYPDPNYSDLKEACAKHYGLSPQSLLPVNGVTEALNYLFRVLDSNKTLLILNPAFTEYKKPFLNLGSNWSFDIEEIDMLPKNLDCKTYQSLDPIEEKLIKKHHTVYINNPQNPTGAIYNRDHLIELFLKYPQSEFIIDEAFIHFSGEKSLCFDFKRFTNVTILRSYTKDLSIPGLRAGMVFSSKEKIEKLKLLVPCWSMNALSAHIVQEYYQKHTFSMAELFNKTQELKEPFVQNLKQYGFEVYPSWANFILIKSPKEDIQNLYTFLLKKRSIAIRTCESFKGLDNKKFARLAIRPLEEQELFFEALDEFYKDEFYKEGTDKKEFVKKRIHASHTPAIMIQGTTSNAGKSFLTTALCRIFYEDGLKVSPFKSQNMALNSFVTKEGHEIGRAQAVQALACGKEAHSLMNPILLKPNDEMGSQVILHGEPVSSMNFSDYFKIKPKYFEEIKKSYTQLSSESQIMVIEGAGSPSEVNLKKNDIVNMNMARYAKANVYIAADIDRGGMFASFLGTFHTLDKWEQDLVKGMIINRFRGDRSLLDTGITYLEESSGKSVVGCIPQINDHLLPEEDSVEFKSKTLSDQTSLADRIDIAVIDTPRISNFTDIDALKGEPDTRVRLVSKSSELGKPDLIIFCGSKSVVRDLKFLKDSGLAQSILDQVKQGQCELVGICGGYQFLSQKILDPQNVESTEKEVDGLGLLDLVVEMKPQKTLTQVEACFLPWESRIFGYEIHHGESKPLSQNIKELVVVLPEKSSVIGHSSLDHRVWGSYLHGMFDDNQFRRRYLDHHRKKLGKAPLGEVVYDYNVEKSISHVAQIVRNHLDMNVIYKDLGL